MVQGMDFKQLMDLAAQNKDSRKRQVVFELIGVSHGVLSSLLTLSLPDGPTGLHIDFPLFNARQSYSSVGNPLGVKGLRSSLLR